MMRFGQEKYASINENLNRKFAEKGVLIGAHRGAWHGNIIQNTTWAFKAALMMGADIVETDTTATRDGVVYCIHDGVEPLLFGPPRNTVYMTSAQVDTYSTLNVLGVQNLCHAERLEEVCAFLNHGELINIDRSWMAKGLVPSILDKHPHMLSQAILKAPMRHPEVIAQLNEHPTKYMFMPICFTIKDIEDALSYKDVNTVGVEMIATSPDSELLTKEGVEFAHAHGLFTWVNTLVITDLEPDETLCAGHDDDVSIKDDPAKGWGWLMDLGVDVLQTDWPSLVRDYRAQKKVSRA